MKDQAEKLRQIINNIKLKQCNTATGTSTSTNRKNTKIITITSGKGGVGKTNIAVNLAIALSNQGKGAIIFDADLGLANIEVLLGVTPKYTLEDVVFNNKSIFDIISTGPNNIRYISGGSGVEQLTKLNNDHLNRFIYNIGLLDKIADIILIDTGAGLSDNVLSFVMAADEVILVTTPEPTSITDAYALIKMISVRDREKRIRLIVNRAENEKEAKKIFNNISLVVQKFLGMELLPLGYILQDQAVMKSVKLQYPYYLKFPNSSASLNIDDISRRLISEGNSIIRDSAGIKGFMSKLIGYMRG
jgi:flagellar biosynthesis protein FlhG